MGFENLNPLKRKAASVEAGSTEALCRTQVGEVITSLDHQFGADEVNIALQRLTTEPSVERMVSMPEVSGVLVKELERLESQFDLNEVNAALTAIFHERKQSVE